MKKLLTMVLALVLMLTLCAPALAVSGDILTLEASGNTTSVTVSGTVKAGILAVMTKLLDSSGGLVTMYSFPVSDGAFSGTITGVTLAAGIEYTMEAANYDGGYWKSTAFTVPVPPAPSIGGELTIPVMTDGSVINVGVKVSDSTAAVDIDASKLGNELDKSVQSGDVTMDLTGLDKDIDAVIIPAAAIGAVSESAGSADNGATGLTVKLTSGTVSLDAKTLAAVGNTDDVTISLKTVEESELTAEQKTMAGGRPVIDVTVLSGTEVISDLGGGSITVSIPYTPQAGENTDDLVIWHLNEKGKLEAVKCQYKDGKLTFTLAHLSRYIAAIFPFKDVAADKWYYGNAAYAYMTGLMDGVGDGVFDPESPTTRAMLVTILYRLEGKPAVTGKSSFSDVADGQWYTDAVIWAAENNIVTGYDGAFSPEDKLTREQMTVILYNYMEYKGCSVSDGENYDSFADAADVSPWADDAMKWAVYNVIVTGVENNQISPQGKADRAQIAAVLERFVKNVMK